MRKFLWLIIWLLPAGGCHTSPPAALPADTDFAAAIQPAPMQSRFVDPGYFTWGASLAQGDDGRYHLFYSRWPLKYGHNAWVSHSEIAHATADEPGGPYAFSDVALPARGEEFWDGSCTHNPHIHRIGGKYYLYYMGNRGDGTVTGDLNFSHRNNQRIGVAVADSPYGPWERFDAPLIDVSADSLAPDALMVSNPSLAHTPEGRYLMVYKAVRKQREGIAGGPVVHMAAIADSPTGPFTKYARTIFDAEGSDFPAEDPYIWCDGEKFWAIVKDMHGAFTPHGRSLVLFTSPDGVDWKPALHPLVSKLEVRWADGSTEQMMHLERPQLWMRNGRPALLFLAADTSRVNSFNVHLPLKF